MNKLFIGLLIIAAAGGTYYFLQKKKEQSPASVINKEWIIGKWKPELTQPAKDSAPPVFRYEFQKDGIALRSVSDTVKADTVSYAWKEKNTILIKEKPADTTGILFTIARLTQDSLQVTGEDNTGTLFTKMK